MSRLPNLWPLICCACVAATPFKIAYFAENKPQSNLQLLIPLKLYDDQEYYPREREQEYSYPKNQPFASYWFDVPYNHNPSEFFHRDDAINTLTQLLDQKTVKKDLSKFTQSPLLRQRLAEVISPFKVDDDYSIARCEHFLHKSSSSNKKSDYNHLLKNLCLLHLQLRTNEPSGKVQSDGFGWNSNGDVSRSVFANLLGVQNYENKAKGKLGNIAVNGYGGYVGNLGVGGKGQYVGNVGVGGKGGVYGNLGIGGQGALFGNLGIGGQGGQLDNVAYVQDDWATNYQNSLLELLMPGNFGHEKHKNDEQPQHKLEVAGGAELNNNNSPTNGKMTVMAHAEKENNGMFINAVPHADQGFGINNNNEALEKVKPISHAENVHEKVIARDSSGSYKPDDCASRSYLFNGKGGLVGNLAIDNYSVSELLTRENPCIYAYAMNVFDDKNIKIGKHSSSTLYVPLKWFRPINGRRDWTSLGGHDKKLRQYISMTKPLVIV